MGARLRGWSALRWPDRTRLLLMMLLGLPIVAASLRLSGYVKTRRRVERLSTCATTRTTTPDDLDNAQQLARLAAVAGRRGPVHATCLRQSLLIYGLLRRRGLAPELKIGVRKQGAAMDAHAWVELDGVALASAEIEHQAFQPHGVS